MSAIVAASVFGTLTAAFALPAPREADSVVAPSFVQEIGLATSREMDAFDAPFVHRLRVDEEDTLSRLLARGGISDPTVLLHFQTDRHAATGARKLRPGQTVQAVTTSGGEVLRLILPDSRSQQLSIERNGTQLVSRLKQQAAESLLAYGAGTIDSSLFEATDRASIPDSVAIQIAEIFSGEVDFHRDIRQGDGFSVVYERQVVDGENSDAGQVVAASYRSGSRELIAIRHTDQRGKVGYYDVSGQSLKRAFLRSPLAFSRITSRFTGSRFHPVLRRWRAHSGIDYGAPTGTPVRATADGIVDFAGWRGGYGKLVVVRHSGNRSTAYGHLNAFAGRLTRGSRVEQGQTIGFVGMTGLASGPHLHYEFRVNGKAINPLTATIPDSPPLPPSEVELFRPQAAEAAAKLALAQRISAYPSQ